MTSSGTTDAIQSESGTTAVRDAPLVSVIVPAFNAEATIIAALESVAAQTFHDWELIVCDDDSADGTAAAVESFIRQRVITRSRVLALPHGGPAEARNRGVAVARGQFVAFLDDDDTWEPQKLARCVEVLMRGPFDLVCHAETWVDDQGASELRLYSGLFDRKLHPLVSLMRNNPFSTSALVVRRAELLKAGPFDPMLPSAEDYDLWIRLAMIPGIRIGFLDEALGTYRVRAGSESAATDRRLRALLAIGSRYAERAAVESPFGRLEGWIFRAKSYFTSGVRFMKQGRRGRGVRLLVTGLLMWPFRFDWVRFAVRKWVGRRSQTGS